MHDLDLLLGEGINFLIFNLIPRKKQPENCFFCYKDVSF